MNKSSLLYFGTKQLFNKYGFKGYYNSWKKAENNSSGYDKPLILEKVKNIHLNIQKNGVPTNSFVPWQVTSLLLFIAGERGNSLNIIDYGGSLGTTFFYTKKYFQHINLHWNIIEQEHFVKCGKKLFEDETLRFYSNLESCLKENTPDVVLLSGVLQYFENPYDFINDILNTGVNYIIFDRTTFSNNGKEFITVQKVHPSYYDASYPCWFFNKQKFLDTFAGRYVLFHEFKGTDGADLIMDFRTQFSYYGFIFRKT